MRNLSTAVTALALFSVRNAQSWCFKPPSLPFQTTSRCRYSTSSSDVNFSELEAEVIIEEGSCPDLLDLKDRIAKLQNETVKKAVNDNDLLPSSPPLSYNKYLTMQDKRVRVTIRYSNGDGLKPYFLTVAKKIKQSHPDISVDRVLLPTIDTDDNDREAIFEVLVDGKIVVGKGNTPRRQKVARVDMARARSVFVSMEEVDLAVSRARRKRRPSTIVYGSDE